MINNVSASSEQATHDTDLDDNSTTSYLTLRSDSERHGTGTSSQATLSPQAHTVTVHRCGHYWSAPPLRMLMRSEHPPEAEGADAADSLDSVELTKL